MARITIIPSDHFVAVDGASRPVELDLSTCGIPDNVHALQWYDARGWVEFTGGNDPFTAKEPNLDITELPAWAVACVAVHEAWTPPVPVATEPQPQTHGTETL